MKDSIEKSILDSAECIKKATNLSEMVEKAIKEIINCLKNFTARNLELGKISFELGGKF